ncbi:glycosyltransferase [Pelagibacteraceae bacterium]|nr:glycosyltransferase [Pelagibacteraceae bacterium]
MIKSVSIIYPVFNEEKRLRKTFLDIKKFEKLNKFLKKEYIFVNDGSSDQTLSIIKNEFKNNKNIKVILISYNKNMGKGYALKRGVQIAKNDWVLTTDADCSVSNFQLIKWIKKKYLDQNNLIYFGSRNLSLSIVKKKNLRKIVGIIFKFTIRFFFNIKISDTQCGFKLYKLNTARKIFRKISIYDYMHDIEICIIAKKLNIKIKDLPLRWTHVDQSKINFIQDFFNVAFSLIKISRINH